MGILDMLQAQRIAQQGRMAPAEFQMTAERAHDAHDAQISDQQARNQALTFAMQNQRMNQQKFDMERNAQAVELKRQQDEATAKQNGLKSYIDYLKNPEMLPQQPEMRNGNISSDPRPGVYGPDVRPVVNMKPAQAAPLDFATVSRSILKNNPNIDPQAFAAALDRFKPQFEHEDKMKLEQFQQLAKQQNAGAGTVEEQIYATALKNGKTPEEAANMAANYKRGQGVPGAQLMANGELALRTGATDAIGASAQAKAAGTKGGELEVKREEGYTKAESALNQFKQNATTVQDTIQKAMEAAKDPMATGWGSMTSFVPNSPAGKLKGYLDSIKANIGFDKLQSMRDSSPTGGALGQVSDFENKLLQAVNGALDPAQADLLKENLRVISDLYPRLVADRERAFQQDYGSTKKGGSEQQGAAQNADPLGLFR